MSNKKVSAFRYIAHFTQVGVSVVVPLVGSMWLGSWLINDRGWPGWTIILWLVLGLLAAVGAIRNFLRFMQKESERGRDDDDKS